MLILRCPVCGATADESELAPGGEAHLVREAAGSDDAAFERYLFARRAPKGVHFERWRHAMGCGKWFHAARDTVTLRVYGTYAADAVAPPPEILEAIAEDRPGWSYGEWTGEGRQWA